MFYLHVSPIDYFPIVPAAWRVGDVTKHHYGVGGICQDLCCTLSLQLPVQNIPRDKNTNSRIKDTLQKLTKISLDNLSVLYSEVPELHSCTHCSFPKCTI